MFTLEVLKLKETKDTSEFLCDYNNYVIIRGIQILNNDFKILLFLGVMIILLSHFPKELLSFRDRY